jgi:hypothetical protein
MSTMLVRRLLPLLSALHSATATTLHLGLIGPTRASYCGYESVAESCLNTMAPAVDLAVEAAMADGLLNDTQVR